MIRIKGLDHVVIRAQDAEAMIKFYCDVLGCVVEPIDQRSREHAGDQPALGIKSEIGGPVAGGVPHGIDRPVERLEA